MKVHIEDADALRAISPIALGAYIRAQGWHQVGAYGKHSDIYDKKDSVELILPTTVDIADYASVISDIIQTLARVEDRAELQIYRDVSVADCDVVRNRIPNADDDGSVRLEDGVSLFVHSRDLLLSAACAAKEKRTQYRAGGIKDANDYMDRVRLGQTEQGSFIVTLLTPVPMALEPSRQASLWPEVIQEPYERQVTRTLMTSLIAAKKAAVGAVKGSGLESFRAAISSGVSVNSCIALSSLTDHGEGLDISVTWASTRPTPEPRSSVHFTRDEGEIFKEAARYLGEIEPRPDENIHAFVVTLERGPEKIQGRVSLKTFLDGKAVSISTYLEENMYREASKANTDKNSVSIKGDLVRKGQRWHLENPRNLVVIENDDFGNE